MSWLPWKKQQQKEKPITSLISDLGLKIYTDDSLKSRTRMVYLLHLAIQGGTVPPPEDLGLDEADKNIQIINDIKRLSNSDKYTDQLDALKLQLTFMDLILRTSSIQWFRAKDDRKAAKILFGWEGLFSKSKTVITAVENILAHNEEEGLVSKFMNRSELLYNLKVFLTLVPFKYGLLISDISYGNEDILPTQIAVLHQNVVDGSGRGVQRKRDDLFGEGGMSKEELRRMIREERGV